jgi:cysteinyl-tRNA synthetase
VSLRLYNSRTRTQDVFQPIDPAHIGMYVCGPTVYDRAHIGNARPVVVFDILFRLLKRRYGEGVTYVRNITDVDDKIIAAAANNKEPIAALTERTTAYYHKDMAALNCLDPTIEPRATAHIPQMIALIETLIEKGNAYEAEGHVLFAVGTSPDYGALSGRNRDEQIAGARVEVAPYKRDPADFVLWKPSETSEAAWDSPWGRGRPGWHIECSAMAAAHLGERFDIHGGGIDLIFPHHENEVAQSTCAHGVPPANVWMHNGHVVVDGQKMSKSLGNFITVEDLLKRWPGEVIRLALMSAHYRQPLDVTEALLASSKARLDYMYGVLRRQETQPPQFQEIKTITEALEDDLNTPLALTVLQKIAKEAEEGSFVAAAQTLRESGEILGLLQYDPEAWFRWQPENVNGLPDNEINRLVEERLAARKQKNFVRADEIRALLAKENIVLEDSGSETFWRRGL